MTDKNIYQRLHAIMADISYVQKENKKVNNQYTFVSHDAVTAKIRPAFISHGVIAVPNFFDISQDGNRTHCSVGFTFVNIDKPEDKVVIDCAGFGQGIDPQDKGAGKAMSYAVKYALLKVFGLETGDDPEKDNINHVNAEEVDRKRAEDLTASLIKTIAALSSVERLDEFQNSDKIGSLRDELYDLDRKLSTQVANAIKDKEKSFVTPSPSGLE